LNHYIIAFKKTELLKRPPKIMMDNKKLFTQVSLISVCILVISILIFYFLKIEYLAELLWGCAINLVLFVIWQLLLSWALQRPLKTLLTVIMGGLFGRFIVIGIIIFILIKFSHLNVRYFLISVLGFYLVTHIFEIRFYKLMSAQKKNG
jgi:hypothetical protein